MIKNNKPCLELIKAGFIVSEILALMPPAQNHSGQSQKYNVKSGINQK